MEVFIDYLNEVNWIAVLVAAFAAFFVGSIWYMKQTFGKRWQKEIGLSDKSIKNANMLKLMGVSFVTVIISALSISILVQVLVLDTALQGALLGVMVATGIIGTNKLMQVQYEQKSWTYWFIVAGYDVVAYGIMGAILAVWQ